jgi:hypothetical protein
MLRSSRSDRSQVIYTPELALFVGIYRQYGPSHSSYRLPLVPSLPLFIRSPSLLILNIDAQPRRSGRAQVVGRVRARRDAPHVRAHVHDAKDGDHVRQRVQGPQHPGLLPPVRRPGGGRHRDPARARSHEGRVDHQLPVPLRRPGPGRVRQEGRRRIVRRQGRHDAGQGREHALLQQGVQLLWRAGHCWRASSCGDRPRLCRQGELVSWAAVGCCRFVSCQRVDSLTQSKCVRSFSLSLLNLSTTRCPESP